MWSLDKHLTKFCAFWFIFQILNFLDYFYHRTAQKTYVPVPNDDTQEEFDFAISPKVTHLALVSSR